jgi:hypothetical protein
MILVLGSEPQGSLVDIEDNDPRESANQTRSSMIMPMPGITQGRESGRSAFLTGSTTFPARLWMRD